MARSLLTRAQNSAASSPVRRKVFDAVLEHADDLEDAARSGIVPVSAISDFLRQMLGDELDNSTLKQYVGLCVVAVLEERGYSVVRPRVRIANDPVFGVGALFSRQPAQTKDLGSALLHRFVDVLSIEELTVAGKLIQARLTLLSSPPPRNSSSS